LTLDLSRDGDLGGDDLRVHPGALFHVHRALGFNLALRGALNPDAMLRADRTLYRRLLTDHGLDLLA
jgi:hypothetical protein